MGLRPQRRTAPQPPLDQLPCGSSSVSRPLIPHLCLPGQTAAGQTFRHEQVCDGLVLVAGLRHRASPDITEFSSQRSVKIFVLLILVHVHHLVHYTNCSVACWLMAALHFCLAAAVSAFISPLLCSQLTWIQNKLRGDLTSSVRGKFT